MWRAFELLGNFGWHAANMSQLLEKFLPSFSLLKQQSETGLVQGARPGASPMSAPSLPRPADPGAPTPAPTAMPQRSSLGPLGASQGRSPFAQPSGPPPGLKPIAPRPTPPSPGQPPLSNGHAAVQLGGSAGTPTSAAVGSAGGLGRSPFLPGPRPALGRGILPLGGGLRGAHTTPAPGVQAGASQTQLQLPRLALPVGNPTASHAQPGGVKPSPAGMGGIQPGSRPSTSGGSSPQLPAQLPPPKGPPRMGSAQPAPPMGLPGVAGARQQPGLRPAGPPVLGGPPRGPPNFSRTPQGHPPLSQQQQQQQQSSSPRIGITSPRCALSSAPLLSSARGARMRSPRANA